MWDFGQSLSSGSQVLVWLLFSSLWVLLCLLTQPLQNEAMALASLSRKGVSMSEYQMVPSLLVLSMTLVGTRFFSFEEAGMERGNLFFIHIFLRSIKQKGRV